jgi:hypothetical protein
MSLRIRKTLTGKDPSNATDQDGWLSRLTKLIPAEALVLYGAGQALIPNRSIGGIRVLAFACLLFSGFVRFRVTRDGAAGGPQWLAIFISSVSFLLWLLTLKPPAGPFDLGDHAYYASLLSLFWVTFLPYVYKGD